MDVRLVQRTDFPIVTEVSCDWLLRDDGTLDDTQALATAVIVALGTDRLADPSDILPNPDDDDRAGWWGDLQAESIWGGWPIGSRLWLLKRAKITDETAFEGSTLRRAEFYIYEALQPFLALRIVSQVYVSVARIDKQRIDALVRLYRGPRTAIELQYQILWEEMIGG